MSLFQKSVVNKYLSNLDSDEFTSAYNKFQEFYDDSERIENIKLLKEENYQEGFLREIFVQVLGYTINPDKNYNLTTEYKNETDSKKADGAIIQDGKAIGVIELKSTKTVNLESITTQAFNYKNHQSGCKYVITSNFAKLRFYIENATEWEEFNLFTMTEKDFKLFYLLLNSKNLLSGIPLRVKEESRLHEENISDKLYKDYSQFKHKIYNNLVKNNPQYDKLLLFKKSQKLLDRLLFILFAEDSGLVPPNAISRIVDQWKQLKALDEEKPLYSRFVKFFNHLNVGHTYEDYTLPAYNGGLFREDEILDTVKIDDEVLLDDILTLSAYDFSTEVDVNILGHIFEHSLSEIEEVTAQIEGTLVEREKSKRKKDGIFYTPKYITKYIVDNTVGALCSEKKKELNVDVIDEAILENSKTVKGTLTQKAQDIFINLDKYREYILSLKILDPACGSGAFLNQALEFLINEHKWIDEQKASLLKESFIISEYEKNIVENNLYGVDINEEAVEIAKLSLWLRTAKKGRKLSTLSNNIKCGNSLIDDPEVAGEKAFKWNEEFKEIMNSGGFDVVIGNPPYVDIKGLNPNLVNWLFANYNSSENRINLYSIFVEKGYSLLKRLGYFSFIIPNSILMNSSYKKIREKIISDLSSIVKLPDNVFVDASVETIIFELRKDSNLSKVKTLVYNRMDKIEYINNSLIKFKNKTEWLNDKYKRFNIYVSDKELEVLRKIEKDSIKLMDIADFTLGITPYDKYKGHSQELIKEKRFHSHKQINASWKPLIKGENITRYKVSDNVNDFIHYGNWLGAMREERFFYSPRIIVRQIISGNPPRIYSGYTEKPLYFTQIGFGIIPKIEKQIEIKYLLSILNSKLITFYHKFKFLDLEKDVFQKILIANCKEFPIRLNNETQTLISYVDLILTKLDELEKVFFRFTNRVNSSLKINLNVKKLEQVFSDEFEAFIDLLNKNKIKLPLNQQDEWEDYFNEYKTRINQLQEQITKTDNEIDIMVYKLYNLTYDEVKIVDPDFWMSEEKYGKYFTED